jgi:hypothetical protein
MINNQKTSDARDRFADDLHHSINVAGAFLGGHIGGRLAVRAADRAQAQSTFPVGPAQQPILNRLAGNAQIGIDPDQGAYFHPGKNIINAGLNPTSPTVLHEIGHARIYGNNPTGLRGTAVNLLDTPGRMLVTSKGLSLALVLSYFDTILDPLARILSGDDKKALVSQVIEWYKLNRGTLVGTAAGLTLLHEAMASIIGAYLGKKHLNIPYLKSAKELVPAFLTYAGALVPHIYASNLAQSRARAEAQKTAANTSLVVLFADDIADLAVQGYKLRHMLPINHKSDAHTPSPVEVKKPEPKIAMMGNLGAGAAGAGVGAGLGAFIAGKGNRRLGAAIGGIIGSGMGVAARQKTPTYDPPGQSQ